MRVVVSMEHSKHFTRKERPPAPAMKKRTLIISLCLLIWGTAVCMGQSKCSSIADGEISGQTYTNKELGLTYTFPALLTSNPSTSLPRGKNGRVLLLLWKTPPDFEKPNVTILTDDPSVYPDRTPIGYLHRIENTAKRYNPPAKIMASGREYDFSGIKFYRVDYQFPEPTLTFNTAITGQVGNCEITFQFVARTQREIETFVQSINMVRFSKP
jgi:hypothetical protein